MSDMSTPTDPTPVTPNPAPGPVTPGPMPPELPQMDPPLGVPPTGPVRLPPGADALIGVPDNTPQEVPVTPPGSPQRRQ